MSNWYNTIGHINGVLMCKIMLLLKISVIDVHLILVKYIPKTFQIQIPFMVLHLVLEEV